MREKIKVKEDNKREKDGKNGILPFLWLLYLFSVLSIFLIEINPEIKTENKRKKSKGKKRLYPDVFIMLKLDIIRVCHSCSFER